jgi:hypothetical protein
MITPTFQALMVFPYISVVILKTVLLTMSNITFNLLSITFKIWTKHRPKFILSNKNIFLRVWKYVAPETVPRLEGRLNRLFCHIGLASAHNAKKTCCSREENQRRVADSYSSPALTEQKFQLVGQFTAGPRQHSPSPAGLKTIFYCFATQETQVCPTIFLT